MISKVNLREMADSIPALFTYLRVGTLNGHMLNVLKAENRTLDFHIHAHSDELFYCIDGEFDIEFDDGLTHLYAGELVIVPKGTRHRPVCKGPATCLLIELEGTLNNGNTGGTFEPS